MSDFPTLPERLRGPRAPLRVDGGRAVRPRAAATLIVTRRDGPTPRILMGRRNSGHKFMPNAWVFPGGRVDRADHRAPYATDLAPEAAAIFEAHIPASRGRALALAAVRETFEEVGLLLAKPAPPRPGAGPWREFLGQGALPDLAALDVIGRAITPPEGSKRFDTWFLTAEAEHLMSLDRQPDCGELEEIAWFDFDEAMELNLPIITRVMLKDARARMDAPDRPRPFFRTLYGQRKTTSL